LPSYPFFNFFYHSYANSTACRTCRMSPFIFCICMVSHVWACPVTSWVTFLGLIHESCPFSLVYPSPVFLIPTKSSFTCQEVILTRIYFQPFFFHSFTTSFSTVYQSLLISFRLTKPCGT
jgi:hypothetical protein